MTEPRQPHDALFKRTFSDVEHAAAELRVVLPTELVARIDFATLQLCPGSYVDQTLAGSQSDLLFSVQLSGKPALLYLLFEHQSSPDRLLALRLLRYVVRVLERHVDEAATVSAALPLPVVVPVVLYHGEVGWSAPTRLEDLFDAQLIAEAGVSELIPRLGFVLDDLSQVSDEQLAARALGLLPLLTLWALRDARNPERLEKSFARWAGTMTALLEAPDGTEAFGTIFRYIALVADDSVAAILSRALESAEPEIKDTLMTLAEKWKAEGEARGRARGRAEGKAEGKAELLRKLLALKFGELTEVASQCIATASEAELDRLVERVLTADTLDAVIKA